MTPTGSFDVAGREMPDNTQDDNQPATDNTQDDSTNQSVQPPAPAEQNTAPSGGAQADTADRNTQAVTPLVTYNQQDRDGAWQQVTRFQDGHYDSKDISPDEITSDQATVYNAQLAATHGFKNPEIGAPLLSGSTQGAQTADYRGSAQAAPQGPATAAQAEGTGSAHGGPVDDSAYATNRLANTGAYGTPTTPSTTGSLGELLASRENARAAGQDTISPAQDVSLGSTLGQTIQHPERTLAAIPGAQGVANVVGGITGGVAGLAPEITSRVQGMENPQAQTQFEQTSNMPGFLTAAGQAAGGLSGIRPGVEPEVPRSATDITLGKIAGVIPFGAAGAAEAGLGETATAGEALQAANLARSGKEIADRAAALRSGAIPIPDYLAHPELADEGVSRAVQPPRIVAGEGAPAALKEANVAAYGSEKSPAEAVQAPPAVAASSNSARAAGVSGSLFHATTPADALSIITDGKTDVPVTPRSAVFQSKTPGAVVEFDPSVDVQRLGSQPRDSVAPTFSVNKADASAVRSITFDKAPSAEIRAQLNDNGFSGETLSNGKIQYTNDNMPGVVTTDAGGSAAPPKVASETPRDAQGLPMSWYDTAPGDLKNLPLSDQPPGVADHWGDNAKAAYVRSALDGEPHADALGAARAASGEAVQEAVQEASPKPYKETTFNGMKSDDDWKPTAQLVVKAPKNDFTGTDLSDPDSFQLAQLQDAGIVHNANHLGGGKFAVYPTDKAAWDKTIELLGGRKALPEGVPAVIDSTGDAITPSTKAIDTNPELTPRQKKATRRKVAAISPVQSIESAATDVIDSVLNNEASVAEDAQDAAAHPVVADTFDRELKTLDNTPPEQEDVDRAAKTAARKAKKARVTAPAEEDAPPTGHFDASIPSNKETLPDVRLARDDVPGGGHVYQLQHADGKSMLNATTSPGEHTVEIQGAGTNADAGRQGRFTDLQQTLAQKVQQDHPEITHVGSGSSITPEAMAARKRFPGTAVDEVGHVTTPIDEVAKGAKVSESEAAATPVTSRQVPPATVLSGADLRAAENEAVVRAADEVASKPFNDLLTRFKAGEIDEDAYKKGKAAIDRAAIKAGSDARNQFLADNANQITATQAEERATAGAATEAKAKAKALDDFMNSRSPNESYMLRQMQRILTPEEFAQELQTRYPDEDIPGISKGPGASAGGAPFTAPQHMTSANQVWDSRTAAAAQKAQDLTNRTIDFVLHMRSAVPAGMHGGNAIKLMGAGADQAMKVLSGGIINAVKDLRLSGDEWSQVEGLLEGIGKDGQPFITSSASPKALFVANMEDNMNKLAWTFAHRFDVIDAYRDDYLTRMVRFPEKATVNGESVYERDKYTGLNNLTPAALSTVSRFAKGRTIDAQTIHEFEDALQNIAPGATVVHDPAYRMAGHLQSLGTAANHAALKGFLREMTDADTGTLKLLTDKERAVIRNKALADGVPDPTAAYQEVKLPLSFNVYDWAGSVPKEGNVVMDTRGRVVRTGERGSQSIVAPMPLRWAHPDLAPALNDYGKSYLTTGRTAGAFGALGEVYHGLNSFAVSMKMMNPIIHGLNALSETIDAIPRQLYGQEGSFPERVKAFMDADKEAKEISADPVRLASWVMDHPMVTPFVDRMSRELANATGVIPRDRLLFSGLKAGADASLGKLQAANHKLLFEKIIQPDMIRGTIMNEAAGMDSLAAAATASAKYMGIRPSDLDGAQKWVSANAVFAPPWTNGTIAQIASTYGGVKGLSKVTNLDKYLTGNQMSQIATALRADYITGTATHIATTAVLNGVLSSAFGGEWKWPWQNDAGRANDINTGHVDPKTGKTIYVSSPFFRRSQDMLRMMAVPGTPVAGAMGTNSLATLYGKTTPVIGSLTDLVGGAAVNKGTPAQYWGPSYTGEQPGPPMTGLSDTQKKIHTDTHGVLGDSYSESLEDGAKQWGAWVAGELSPASFSSRIATKSPAPDDVNLKHPHTEIQLPFGATWTDKGLVPPDPGSPVQVAAGLSGALLSARELAGGRYLNPDQQTQDDLDKYKFSATTQKVYKSVGREGDLLTAGQGGPKDKVPFNIADKAVYMQKKAEIINKWAEKVAPTVASWSDARKADQFDKIIRKADLDARGVTMHQITPEGRTDRQAAAQS